MSLPPLPLSYENVGPISKEMGHGHVYLLDANGRKIGVFWGKPDEKIALAELICGAADKVPA